MAATKKKTPNTKTTAKPKAKTGKHDQHCKKCGKSGHNSRRHKGELAAKLKSATKAPLKKSAKKK